MLLDPKHEEDRFTREAKVAANLHHTNIVPVFGVGEHDGMHYYAMQFIHGLGLDEVLVELRHMRKENGSAAGNGRPTVGAVKVHRHSVRKEVSAVAAAESLVTGQFLGTAFFDSKDSHTNDKPSSSEQTRELKKPSSPKTHAAATRDTTTGHLSDTFPSPARLSYRANRTTARNRNPRASPTGRASPGSASRWPRPSNMPTIRAHSIATSSRAISCSTLEAPSG